MHRHKSVDSATLCSRSLQPKSKKQSMTPNSTKHNHTHAMMKFDIDFQSYIFASYLPVQ